MDQSTPPNPSITRPNRRSTLLSLPAELRTKIYLHLLDNKIIHIGGTGHQPYTDEHLPHGRSNSCMAKLSDPACHALYTQQNKAFKGTMDPDRFSARHRDCFRYPVSHTLNLSILLTNRQIYTETHMLPFTENTFTLSRPHSLPQFLERLTPAQMHTLRKLRIYSTASPSTWIGPLFSNQNFDAYLTGLRKVKIFVELKPVDLQFESVRTEEVRRKWRLSGGGDV